MPTRVDRATTSERRPVSTASVRTRPTRGRSADVPGARRPSSARAWPREPELADWGESAPRPRGSSRAPGLPSPPALLPALGRTRRASGSGRRRLFRSESSDPTGGEWLRAGPVKRPLLRPRPPLRSSPLAVGGAGGAATRRAGSAVQLSRATSRATAGHPLRRCTGSPFWRGASVKETTIAHRTTPLVGRSVPRLQRSNPSSLLPFEPRAAEVRHGASRCPSGNRSSGNCRDWGAVGRGWRRRGGRG